MKIKTFNQFLNESEEKEKELFNADDVRRQLKKQDSNDEEINKYIERTLSHYKEGDVYTIDAGSPGIGKFAYRVTKVTDKCIFGIYLEDESNVRELDPSEVM